MSIRKANSQLLAGLVMLPALLFQNSFDALVLQTVLAVCIALLSGRKFKLLPNLMILFAVVVANIFQPNGKLLFSILGYPITSGAILIGLHKSFLLIGLLYLSQYMVSGNPAFPGKLGNLIAQQFYYFDLIRNRWSSLDKRHPIEALDSLLISFDIEENGYVEAQQHGYEAISSPGATVKTICFVACFWILFFIGNQQWIDVIEPLLRN
ncbi:MAG: hypothetical protein PHU24_01660 [Sphaerochaetaceae bacterium]|jgi:hypothetical protein|nr:hypothetical protein [Sphaerochaetaceae bacterium]NLO61394.1 hypothetical protein [Spirochaetales bacterium]MDD2405144.1 hypothetical protein [Sphaerochaetaceae bacterium]MDD3670264.1 hypothetical protein [Sphaerochaetaceae bacterium]MDD4258904.1 hypothetical protein [Sphaerochaetaceae bacterium]